MQDPRALLKAVMAAGGLRQGDVAKFAHVSQPTVSRLLVRNTIRRSSAQLRLCKYIQEEAVRVLPKDMNAQVVEAFSRIWDGSEEHAAAVVRIINALDGLQPAKRQKE